MSVLFNYSKEFFLFFFFALQEAMPHQLLVSFMIGWIWFAVRLSIFYLLKFFDDNIEFWPYALEEEIFRTLSTKNPFYFYCSRQWKFSRNVSFSNNNYLGVKIPVNNFVASYLRIHGWTQMALWPIIISRTDVTQLLCVINVFDNPCSKCK